MHKLYVLHFNLCIAHFATTVAVPKIKAYAYAGVASPCITTYDGVVAILVESVIVSCSEFYIRVVARQNFLVVELCQCVALCCKQQSSIVSECAVPKVGKVKSVVDYNIFLFGFYEGVNLSLAYCDDCGHEELSMDVCPKCGSTNLTKIDRMNGYLSYSRVKGDTRLNDAKMAEIAERKSM